MPLMPRVKFLNEKKTIEVPDGANLRDEAVKAGIEISSKVLIRNGRENVDPPGAWERIRLTAWLPNFLARISHQDGLRYAKETHIHGDVEVETGPRINWHGEKFWG